MSIDSYCGRTPDGELTLKLVQYDYEDKDVAVIKPADLALLFFDIETSGLEYDCDILQIAVRSGSSTFERFVDPIREIPPEVTRINHFYNRDGQLYRRDEKLESMPIVDVLRDLLLFLSSFEGKCVLVAHNCPFDSERLLFHAAKHSMTKELSRVVDGFTDTLDMFRDKYPKRRWIKGSLTLERLVEENFPQTREGAHDASWDTEMLEKLSLCHFTTAQLIERRTSFMSVLQELRRQNRKGKNFAKRSS